MKYLVLKKYARAVFVMATMLCFLTFSHIDILFAAAPTVMTGSASSITKTTASISFAINNDGGRGLTSKGIEYGTTTSYGLTSASPFFATDSSSDIPIFSGPGTAEGQGTGPYSFAIDSSGNFYGVDSDNNRIQKFNSLGVFQMMFGWGVDTGASAFEICTSGCQAGIAGSGNGQFNDPLDIAIDSSNNIFVMDAGNNRIQKFNSAGVFQVKFGTAGTAEGQFDFPAYGIDFDSSNNIFVLDQGNNRIQKFNSLGVFQMMFGWGVDTGASAFEICTSGCQAGIAGSGNGQFDITNTDVGHIGGLTGLAIDSVDNVYVGDSNNNRIQKFNSAGNYQSQFGSLGTGSGEFQALQEVFIDDNDDIYTIDGLSGSERLQKFDSSFNPYTSFTLPIGAPLSLAGIVLNAEQDVLLLSASYSYIFNINQYPAVSISGLTCGTTYHYRAFATNSDGTSYGNDATFDTLACDLPIVETKAASEIGKKGATLNGLETSDGVSASTVRGFEYGTDTSYGNTTNVSPTSLSFTDFTGGVYNVGNSTAVAKDLSGNIYVLGKNSYNVQVYDSTGTPTLVFGWGVATGANNFETCTSSCLDGFAGSGDGEFDTAEGIAVDNSTGNIYVSDTGNNRIEVFDSSGNYLTKFASPGQFNAPKGIAVHSGNIYVVDSGNNRIVKLNSSGNVLATYGSLGSGVAEFNSPTSIEISDDGYVYIADYGNNRIRYTDTIFSMSGVVSFTEPSGWTTLGSPTGVAIDSDYGLYISDATNNRIAHAARVTPLTYTFVSSYGSTGPGSGQFDGPGGLTVTNDDKLIVSDTNNNRVTILSPFFYKEVKPLTCNTTYHYRAFATNSDGTSYGADESFKTLGGCTTSGGGGGGPPPVYGCTDPAANNYDSSATDDDGSCTYPVSYYGCTNPLATNYDSSAGIDDGSCTYPSNQVPGCTNPLATNYNPLATIDNGSCVLPGGGGPTDVLGCADSFADNYQASATVDDGSCHYSISIVGCIDPSADNYDPNATIDNGSCYHTTPPPWPPIVPIVTVIQTLTGLTPEQQGNVAKDIAVAGLVVPTLFYILTERAALASVALRLWNIIPTLLGFKRKRRPWGTVFDSVTKQPLDPVYVTLMNQMGAEAGTSITDLDGRYGFYATAGEYAMNAKKGDYVFPSLKLKGSDHDELYDNLYFGEKIIVEGEDEIINKNIPMDAINFNWNEFEKARRKGLTKFFSRGELFMAHIAKILFIAGFVASVFLAMLEPKLFNYIILGIYVVIFVLGLFGIRPTKPGFAWEKSTGLPLSFAILSVFSALLNTEVGHTVIGKTGRYHILVPKGRYYIKLKIKTGENSYQEVYTSDVFRARKGYINKVIKV